MPFSDNRNFKKNPRLIVEAKGVYVTNHEGKKWAHKIELTYQIL